jgi:hypothetical protein
MVNSFKSKQNLWDLPVDRGFLIQESSELPVLFSAGHTPFFGTVFFSFLQ